jgi:hypothetical protein
MKLTNSRTRALWSMIHARKHKIRTYLRQGLPAAFCISGSIMLTLCMCIRLIARLWWDYG